MSILKKLKSLFVVEDDEGSPQPHEDESHSKSKTLQDTSDDDVSVGKEEKSKFIDILFKAIEQANIEGYDYLEFKQSINNLKKQNLGNDEKQLFITAYTLAKTMNVDKDSLLKSANHYMQVLENENLRFNESLNNSAKVKLAEREEKLKKLESILQKEKVQLQELQKKIQAHEKQIVNLKEELQQAGQKVKKIKSGFKKALSEISSQISSDVEKIKTYIK